MRTLVVLCLIVLSVAQFTLGDRYSENTTPEEWEEINSILTSWGLGEDVNRGPGDCALCKSVAAALQSFIQANASVTYLDELAYQVCLKIDHVGLTPIVCHGTVREFGPEVIYVFSERFLDPSVVCAFIGICKSAEVKETTPKYQPKRIPATETPKWQAMMKKTLESIERDQQRSKEHPIDVSASGVGTFIHISDIHFDARYIEGANALCERPLCCRASDIFPKNQTGFRSAGKWGDYNCDTPGVLLEDLWDTFLNLTQKPDFILYTGDNSPHDIWAQTQDLQQTRNVHLNEHIQEHLPGWIVFPTLGNHESYPVDQFPNPPDADWLYSSIGQSWGPWLPADAISIFETAGYYTTLIAPGLRLISLNTQYCDCNNFWLLLDWQDPAGQLAWFNQTLAAARQGGEKVWVIGHIPFNSGGCLDSYQTPLWKIVDTYSDVITQLFFGHTHDDSFFVMNDFATNTVPIVVGLVAPSVTPYTEKNNAFRVFSYNRTSFELINYNQYIQNLTAANLVGKPNWFIEYNPIDAYGMTSLSASEWYRVATQQFPQNQNMINNYQYWHTCSYGTIKNCDTYCTNSTICELTGSTQQLVNECQGNPPSSIFSSVSAFMNHFCPAWFNATTLF